MGYPAVATIQTPEDVDALRAERQATIDAETAAKAALKGATRREEQERRGRHGPRAARGLLGGRRRSLALHRGHDDGGVGHEPVPGRQQPHPVRLHRPAARRVVARTPTAPRSAPATCPRTWTPTSRRSRRTCTTCRASASATRARSARRCRPRSRSPRPTATWRRSRSRSGSATAPRDRPTGFMQDFNTHYVDPQEGYARISALATEFSNIAELVDLPNKTPGYQRKAQTVVGMLDGRTPARRPLRRPPRRPRRSWSRPRPGARTAATTSASAW